MLSAPAAGALAEPAVQPPQPDFGATAGGPAAASLAGTEASTASGGGAGIASTGVAPPCDSNVSSGSGDARSDARTIPVRGACASFGAERGGLKPNGFPGGPPHTPRRGCAHLIGPVHGWRIT